MCKSQMELYLHSTSSVIIKFQRVDGENDVELYYAPLFTLTSVELIIEVHNIDYCGALLTQAFLNFEPYPLEVAKRHYFSFSQQNKVKKAVYRQGPKYNPQIR